MMHGRKSIKLHGTRQDKHFSKENECRLEATLGRVMYLVLLTPATADNTTTYVRFQMN
jgi:hypothetical protein